MDTNTIINKKDLVLHAKQGDEAAFAEIVHLYSDKLYTLLMRMLRNEQEAEDALQETFITLVKKIGTFNEESSLFTWLYKVATNAALMRLRKLKLHASVDVDESKISENVHDGSLLPFPSQPDHEVSKKEFKEVLNVSLEKLKPIYRSVFILRDIEQLSVRETSEILKISEENVKTRLRRARIILRNEIAERCR